MHVPEQLQWLARLPGGNEWLAALPELVQRYQREWDLEPEHLEELPVGYVSMVLGVRRRSGEDAVLKLPFPQEESRWEAEALEAWSGHSAVRLHEHDPATRAMLLERCRPGTRLLELDEEQALETMGCLLRDLHAVPVPADGPFRRLADVVPEWLDDVERRWLLHGKPFPQEVVAEARELSAWLTSSDQQPALLHQDLQASNVIDAGDRGWLAIDPKPLVGDPAFDVASAVRDRRPWLLAQPDARDIVGRRILRLSELSGVDPARAAGWSLIHALAWGMDDGARFDDVLACLPLLSGSSY